MDNGFSTALGRYLAAKGIKQADFAAEIQCSQPSVARYVAGKRIPDNDVMKRIIIATDGEITPNDFFGIQRPFRPSSEAAA